MEKGSALRRLNLDLIPAIENLDETIARKLQQIRRESKSSLDVEELKPLINGLRDLRKHRKAIASEASQSLITKDQVENCLRNSECVREQMCNLTKRMDDFAEMFRKYSVPRLSEFETLESYVDAAKVFMKVWRDEAAKRREKGERILIELARRLDDQSDDGEEKRTTFDEMRRVAVDLGSHISYHLCTYFMLIAVTAGREETRRKIRDVKAAIGCLSMEEDSKNSVVIGGFLSVMKHVEATLEDFGDDDGRVNRENNVARWFGSTESNVLYLIMREVLRFEVAFSCSNLPMMLIGEVLIGMANHMRSVFEKKLGKVGLEVNILATELQHFVLDENPDKLKSVQEILFSGMKMVWDKLNLKPTGRFELTYLRSNIKSSASCTKILLLDNILRF